ncbi:Glutathione synthetase [Wallemia ichthyophaga EXF-994]|uniref:Glutathione synthetase n=1 Tax=Wallemia ichthyophaga (strain EXF-994 / CBS 113033) TaxID=1299270 RepID=R9AAW6_WALI9|nr:Glutathione synthetase [Wallemia ichthyophaga EXF-994]EOQ99321.1 Glutathione synthetase [Wallemia ichthyophaga EXF-994]
MEFPPKIEQEYQKELIDNVRGFCLGNGLVLLPPVMEGEDKVRSNTCIQAPVSLFPTPFPKKLFNQANSVGLTFNELYANIARDVEFIDEILSEISPFDKFQASLWNLWKEIRSEICQPNQLLLSRSDYLCNTSTDIQGNIRGISQVEFNTIASSFGGLSNKVNQLHQFLYNDIRYANLHPLLNNQLAENNTLNEIVDGFEHAHQVYKSGYLRSKHSPYILFVVQENERNVFDQRLLEFELSRRNIRIIRRTFAQLSQQAKLSEDNVLKVKGIEVSIVYYRAGYAPEDYKSERDWRVRRMIEVSLAIKCPTLALQLAGCKKVQQVLVDEHVLRKNLNPAQIRKINKCFVDILPFDQSEKGKIAHSIVADRERCKKYVLKPQREGGGNNIYKEDIVDFVNNLKDNELSSYILMELIEPPGNLHNYLVRYTDDKLVKADVVSELGIYGSVLFNNHTIIRNEHAGHLLRTKSRQSDEGGVALGISVIDECLLI